jgi:hypothetical protein
MWGFVLNIYADHFLYPSDPSLPFLSLFLYLFPLSLYLAPGSLSLCLSICPVFPISRSIFMSIYLFIVIFCFALSLCFCSAPFRQVRRIREGGVKHVVMKERVRDLLAPKGDFAHLRAFADHVPLPVPSLRNENFHDSH